MIYNLKEKLAAAKAAGATIVTDIRIVNVSLNKDETDNGVDYWATITLKSPVPGMYKVGDEFKEGLTTTVTTPYGVVMSLLVDALAESESRFAHRLVSFKPELTKDFEEQAQDKRYVSYVAELLTDTKVSVVCRKVAKGKVKSLFSLNERETVSENDTIFHDLFGLSNLDEEIVKEVFDAVKADNKAKKTTAATSSQTAVQDALAAYLNNKSRIDAALA